MDTVKAAMANAVRAALYYGGGGANPLPGKGLVSWRHEITAVSPLETQIKVWPDDNQPPRYFTVQVKEAQ